MEFMHLLSDPDAWISLLTLTALEIVLGIDNLVFLAILAGRLPPAQQPLARRLGLGFALLTRLMLLFMLAWIITLTQPVFEVFGHGVSWRDIILLTGGLFLIGKATHEIHTSLEGEEHADASAAGKATASFMAVVIQIGIIDIVFSLDSVITAVGMAQHLSIMVAAVVLMLIFTRDINGWHTIAAIVILLREIMVSGLREFLAGLQVSVPVSQLAKWKTGFQMISLGALILAGGLPQFPQVQIVGLWTLWAAAILTLLTGWDYLRVGLKHMD